MKHLGFAIRIAALALLVGAAIATPGVASAPSLLAWLTTVSFLGCVAVGMTFITLSGNKMSFCIGATVAVTAVAFVHVLNHAGFAAAVAAALAFGGLLGAALAATQGQTAYVGDAST